MTLNQAISLIGKAGPLLPRPGHTQQWADLGCGEGLFTRALASLLPAGSTVHGIDTAPGLQHQVTPNGVTILPVNANFEKDALALSGLDGILMANSLHYVKDKPALLQKLQAYMKPNTPFLLVEYDTDIPIRTWVPYPLSYSSLTRLFIDAGYRTVTKLGLRPSVYGRSDLYAALILP